MQYNRLYLNGNDLDKDNVVKPLNKLFIYGFMFSCSIILFITFLIAYFNNGIVTININSLGEANLELFILTIFMIYTMFNFGKIIKQEVYKK